MRLDLLINRNHFRQDLKNALIKYLKHSSNWDGEISWESIKHIKATDNFIKIYPKINILASTLIDKEYIIGMGKEFAHHNNIFRKKVQTFYVNNIFRFPISLFSTRQGITVRPWSDILNEIIIIPGNHTIRIIHRGNNICIVIPYNEESEFYKNEIKFRMNEYDLPIPGNFQLINDLLGYSENIISGIPLNRWTDNHFKDEIQKIVKQDLVSFYEKTMIYVDRGSYVETLVRGLNDCQDKVMYLLPKNAIYSIEILIDFLFDMLNTHIPETVPTALTHGDLQLGNILVEVKNRDKYFIIDWEYCDRRMVYFDALTLFTNSRFPKRISERLNNILADDHKNEIKWPFTQSNSIDLTWTIYAFLIEELILRLKEMYESHHYSNSFNILLIEFNILKEIYFETLH